MLYYGYPKVQRRLKLSPRTGRPTDNPKNQGYRLRMTEDEFKMLDFCCKTLNMTKADVIRQGIKEMYQKAQEKQ